MTKLCAQLGELLYFFLCGKEAMRNSQNW